MALRTMFVQQEGCPANALAINRDATQVVIAGRNVFKIFSIDEEELTEKMNLRVGKNMNLNYSCADVVWNPIEDNILATAATNGAVVTWNLEKVSRCKQDMVFQQHKRTVNKVCFHPTESYLLISGSQDGTMKLFDLRRKEVTSTFNSNAESVRDVQFSPHQYFYFAAVQENGSVHIWDMRRTDRFERQFTAHSGPVFACDWHPEEKKWLATAGRDKTIKVWDLSSKLESSVCTIPTIASVARIRWRPLRRHHIASSSLVVDSSVAVWDIRRPYIPFASFDEHKDVATGIVWKNSPDAFLSTSKDATLYLHVFADARRPLDRANPMALDFNGQGDLAFASWERIMYDNSNSGNSGSRQSIASSKLQGFFKKHQVVSDQFPSALSVYMVLQNRYDKFLSMDWLIESAKRYRLSGRQFGEICEHNAAVATELKRPEISQTWNMLKVLYSNNNNLFTNIVTEDQPLDSNLLLADVAVDHQTSGRHHSGEGGRSVTSRHVSGDMSVDRQPGDTSAGLTDDDTETDDTDYDRKLHQITSGCWTGLQNRDFFFGEGDFSTMMSFDYEPLQSDAADLLYDWGLPNEAFQPRHEIRAHSPPPEQLCISSTAFTASTVPKTLESTGSSRNQRSSGLKTEEITFEEPNLLSLVKMDPIPTWDPTSTVANMLNYYATQGDVQMSVSVLIVLGDRIKGVIDDATQEQWYSSYIELLTRYKLWSVANEITKLSPLPNINTMNQQSTTYYTGCSNCGRELHRVAWYCEKCKVFPGICSVCHRVVKGLYVWCQGCCHGGHLNHMKEWMESSQWCPTGCGHKCEYT
ncbi:hypothetical protein CHUAL_001851 [Chamberlinius hualienensis]